MSEGRLIVIDGIDGCGKSTQFKIISHMLEESGRKVKPISFPDYGNESSALVRMYLGGEFSDSPSGVNAYAASSFYAVDRYASYMKYWKSDYESGSIILASRYVSSNAIHQMEKLDRTDWDSYLSWLEDYEYEKLSLPRADKVILLDMPVEISQKFLSVRYNGDDSKKDIHEADSDYLKRCREASLYAAEKCSWSVIRCFKEDRPSSIESVSEMLINEISEVI